MASKEYWMGREKMIAEGHKRISNALYLWPRPRTIEEIEAEERLIQPVAAQEFADPRNS